MAAALMILAPQNLGSALQERPGFLKNEAAGGAWMAPEVAGGVMEWLGRPSLAPVDAGGGRRKGGGTERNGGKGLGKEAGGGESRQRQSGLDDGEKAWEMREDQRQGWQEDRTAGGRALGPAQSQLGLNRTPRGAWS